MHRHNRSRNEFSPARGPCLIFCRSSRCFVAATTCSLPSENSAFREPGDANHTQVCRSTRTYLARCLLKASPGQSGKYCASIYGTTVTQGAGPGQDSSVTSIKGASAGGARRHRGSSSRGQGRNGGKADDERNNATPCLDTVRHSSKSVIPTRANIIRDPDKFVRTGL